MRRRVNRAQIVEHLRFTSEQRQFELGGVWYRFDGRPVLQLVKRVVKENAGKVVAMLFQPVHAWLLAGAALSVYHAWVISNHASERYWRHHYGLMAEVMCSFYRLLDWITPWSGVMPGN